MLGAADPRGSAPPSITSRAPSPSCISRTLATDAWIPIGCRIRARSNCVGEDRRAHLRAGFPDSMRPLNTRCMLLAAATSVALGSSACASRRVDEGTVLTFSGSALGAEGAVLSRQVARYMLLHPDTRVLIQRTPDDATQRHQLYVQWLNAHVGEPDILQLDVIWTAEFAAAGWIVPLSQWNPDVSGLFAGAVAADTWANTLYAMPWWMDVGMLYWRTDLLNR